MQDFRENGEKDVFYKIVNFSEMKGHTYVRVQICLPRTKINSEYYIHTVLWDFWLWRIKIWGHGEYLETLQSKIIYTEIGIKVVLIFSIRRLDMRKYQWNVFKILEENDLNPILEPTRSLQILNASSSTHLFLSKLLKNRLWHEGFNWDKEPR